MRRQASRDAAQAGLTPDQLEALFNAHADRLYRLARRLVSNQDDALDLVQDTFLKAARASTALPPTPVQQEAWLVRILVNLRRDQWRRAAVQRRSAHHLRPESPRHPEPAYLLQASVWEALDHLAPRRRAVLVLREIEGTSIPDIAALLGISTITVRWHLARARREVAQRIRPDTSHEGVPHDDTERAPAGRGPAAARSTAKP
jgi:RNA polymerase sigma-70 factor (ECF subfamily)